VYYKSLLFLYLFLGDIMLAFLQIFHDVLWEYILIYLLLIVGFYFTARLNFVQFRRFGHMFTLLKGSRSTHNNTAGISSFQALCTSLASRVGTGNIAGVAVALYLGGPGAIFWMCLVALVGMATTLVECTLAQLFKVKDDSGNYRGGPAYYIQKGLGQRWLGIAFSLCLILAFGFVFNAVQSHSITHAMGVAFGWEAMYVGIALVIFSGMIIFGGLRKIGRFSEIVVPFMALGYILLALVVIAMNIQAMPAVFSLIIKSAFGWQEAGAGMLGYMMAQAMIQGVKRGLFSNEAGMGSVPNAAATATPYPVHPASQGFIQMLGVFVDTLVICTATAAIILLSGQLEAGSGVTGIELTQRAMEAHVGSWGKFFIAFAILFFAFTTIVANYSYAETNFIFLRKGHKQGLLIFRLGVLGMVMFGSLAELPLVWMLADVSMGLMALINLIAISLLSGLAFKVIKDYTDQLAQGKQPEFDIHKFPEIKHKVTDDIWDTESVRILTENRAG
jgi:alanine or glycine:cation symporter, AGCS family